MGHFTAFYKCFRCRQIIGGLISNDLLLVSKTDKSFDLINPLLVSLKQELGFYCENCAVETGDVFRKDLGTLSFQCKNCIGLVRIFYQPKIVSLIYEDKEIEAETSTLLTLYSRFGWCSLDCFKKQSGEGKRIEILNFRKAC